MYRDFLVKQLKAVDKKLLLSKRKIRAWETSQGQAPQVVLLRFKRKTFREIGEALGCSRQAAYQVYKKWLAEYSKPRQLRLFPFDDELYK